MQLSCHHFAYLPESDAFRAAFPRLRADARLILEHAEQRGIRIAASNALGRPLLEEGWISFNGRYPRHFDGFTLTLLAEAQKRRIGPAGQPIAHSFTRTAHRPYDLPVKAVLLRAHQLAPGHLAIACGDPWDEGWQAARDLLADLFDTRTETSPLTASRGALEPAALTRLGRPQPGPGGRRLPRYLGYLTVPGLISGQLDRFASLQAARSALTAHASPGMSAHLDLYAVDGPAMLAAAEELRGVGVPFDAPDYRIGLGPRGGTRVEKN